MSPKSRDPPSSFPGIWKYPHGRDVPFRTALEWMKGKSVDDDLNGLWRVHDKLYDLSSFAKYHPGGSDWINITRGTDITEAYEVSHIINYQIVENTLSKYFVRDATTPRVSPYTFKNDGFYKTLKRRVETVLKEIGTGPTFEIKLMIDSLVASFLIFSALGVIYNSLIIQFFSGLLLTLVTIGAHNFFHLKENWRKFYFDLSLFSSLEWRISHAFSHHLYPNTIMDAEISMFEPWLEFLPHSNKSWIQRNGPIVYNHVLYGLIFLLDFGKKWHAVLTGQQDFRPEYLLNITQLLIFMILSPGGVLGGLGAWLIINITASYFFGLCGLNAAHHHPTCFHDGDKTRTEPDFGLCQMDAVRDRSDPLIQNSVFVQLVVFGEHSLHHLFPTVCHSKLHYLRPILNETLKEFSEKYPLLTQWELFLGTIEQLKRTEIRNDNNLKIK